MRSRSRVYRKKLRKRIISFLIGLFLVILFILLLGLLNRINNKGLYYNRCKKDNNISINYPYFKNKKINESIEKYYKNISSNIVDEVNYEISIVDNNISILFNKNKDGKLLYYDSFIYDQDGNIINIDSIVTSEESLKNYIKIYLDNNNITINDYPNVEFIYFLEKDGLTIIIISKENNANIFNRINLNYNELSDILKIKYEINKDYIKSLTTTTTTTTTKVVSPDKVISFTFDDGPSKYTSLIMDVFDKYGAKATFFEVGYMMKSRKDTVQEVLSRGFEIGNHTTDHSNLNKLTADKVKEKVYGNNDTFKEITGTNFPLLRPPYGNCKAAVKELIDVPIIKWSVDSRDWESRNKDKIIALVKSNTKSGDIVLFHDLYESTYEAIKVLVPYYYEQGYTIVSVSELFKINNKELENGHIYYSAK